MFLVISTFPKIMISLLSSVIFYQIFFHAVTLYIYLFALSLRSFLPWLEKVKTRPFFSPQRQCWLHYCLLQTCYITFYPKCISQSEKYYMALCILFQWILVIFPLEVFYVSNWFVMLQRYDYKSLKTNQWISVIWIYEAHQSIHSLWNPCDTLIRMLHFYPLPSRSIFIVSFKHLLS